jgi:hypothetical protein
VPYRFRGLETIGVVILLLNLVLYLAIWTLLAIRFYSAMLSIIVSAETTEAGTNNDSVGCKKEDLKVQG